jgi:hypothetical protein
MNERIKELAKQSGVYFGDASKDYFGEYHPAFVTTDKMDVEKFAQLLIEKFAYGLMDLHGSSPEHIIHAAKMYGVEL